MGKADLEGISIRTELVPGDIGLILQRHGELYARGNGVMLPLSSGLRRSRRRLSASTSPRASS